VRKTVRKQWIIIVFIAFRPVPPTVNRCNPVRERFGGRARPPNGALGPDCTGSQSVGLTCTGANAGKYGKGCCAAPSTPPPPDPPPSSLLAEPNILTSGRCGDPITSASECETAVTNLGCGRTPPTQRSRGYSYHPKGCSLKWCSSGCSYCYTYFNTHSTGRAASWL